MKSTNILWGIVLIVIGVIFGLNSLEITNINIFFNGWWTLFIIIPSFIGLFKDKEKTGSIIGILIGLALLLTCQNLLDMSLILKLLLPSIFVMFGLSMIFKTKPKKPKKELKDKSYCSTFSTQTLNFDSEKFEGCELNAIFGGITLDLTKAKIEDDAVIEANTIFGGITIILKENINVKVVSNSIFGGVDNRYKNTSEGKTIYINAACIFGGIDIK